MHHHFGGGAAVYTFQGMLSKFRPIFQSKKSEISYKGA